MRMEGRMWNAYCAENGTMERAALVASIPLDLAQANNVLYEGFMMLAQCAMAEHLKLHKGIYVAAYKPPSDAPEHERAGHA